MVVVVEGKEIVLYYIGDENVYAQVKCGSVVGRWGVFRAEH